MPYPIASRFFIGVCTALCVFSIACRAHAEVDVPVDVDGASAAAHPAHEPSNEPKVPVERYWYGYQTLIVDGTSVAAFATAVALQNAPLGYAAIAGYVAGGPVVHVVNHRPKIAFASAGLRLGLPGVGVLTGVALAGPCHERHESLLGDCFLHGFAEGMIGAGIGMTIAIAVDATVFARGAREVPPRDSVVARVTSLAPVYDPRTRSAGVAVGGSF